MDLERIVKAAKEGNFSAWLELQRYMRYHLLGIGIAKWWLKVRYGWDNDKDGQDD